jgi:serine/threonine protein kinase/Tfp pilus assembly protein PilF
MSVVITSPDAGSFEPGAIFARRYRLVHRLRSSAQTDVWRADDLVLQSQVAVEVVSVTDDGDRQAVLRKILLVRRLKHPAVCRVFDAGEADGRIYCSLELVDGETLRTVVRRAGRLPSEKVADIGRQLCGGLAALHSAGLATTVDPWSVLLDSRGSIRIVDLGLGTPALPATGASPQASPDAPATVRGEDTFWPMPWAASDAYAVGAMLYELLVGASPARGHRLSRAPLRPSMFVANVDSRLEHVIMNAIADDPAKRPASAAAMAVALTRLPGSARPGWFGWVVAAAAVAAVISTLGLLGAWLDPSPPPLTDQDSIVLADFSNTTLNPVFDGTLKVALAVALEQSPFLRIYPDARARETLRLMQRAPDERITAAVARDIARREQLKALVTGAISTAGDGYALTVEAIEASTGRAMAREYVEAASDDDILKALGTAAARLRSQLGESLSSIERFDAPLPRATTASLDALHAYSLALEGGQLIPRVEAIPHLERAIELDPEFAMAYAALSFVYRNTEKSAQAPQFARRAFELRDRVSERERFFISWRYYLDAAQALDRALELAASWTSTYPREAFAFNSLGLAAAAFGDHEQAVRAFREAIRLDPGFVPPHGNLAGSLIASNRFDEAKAQLSAAGNRGIAFITVRRMGYVLAFIRNDARAMASELDLVRQSTDAVWALVWEARRAAFGGETLAAHDLFQRSAEAAAGNGARELAAQTTMEDAELHAIARECDAARGEVAAGLALSRDNFTLERAARALALCDDGDGVKRLTEELRARFPDATLTVRIQLPVIGAIEAWRGGDPARAIDLLDPVTPYDYAPASEFWPAYIRGEAYFLLKDVKSAAAQFRAIVDHRGAAPTSALYLHAQRKLAAIQDLRAPGN